jgi:hypothetical protein
MEKSNIEESKIQSINHSSSKTFKIFDVSQIRNVDDVRFITTLENKSMLEILDNVHEIYDTKDKPFKPKVSSKIDPFFNLKRESLETITYNSKLIPFKENIIQRVERFSFLNTLKSRSDWKDNLRTRSPSKDMTSRNTMSTINTLKSYKSFSRMVQTKNSEWTKSQSQFGTNISNNNIIPKKLKRTSSLIYKTMKN